MLVVPGPVMTRAKPASAASTSASPVSTSRGRPPRSMSFCSGATTSSGSSPSRADHPRGELLVAAAEQEALPADHRDDGRGRAAAISSRSSRLRGAGAHEPAVEHDVDAERASSARRARRASSAHRAAGPEQVADARLHARMPLPRGRATDGRLLVRRGSPPCGPGCVRVGTARRGVPKSRGSTRTRRSCLLVDVEHLALAARAARVRPRTRATRRRRRPPRGGSRRTPASTSSRRRGCRAPRRPPVEARRRRRARCRRRRRTARGDAPASASGARGRRRVGAASSGRRRSVARRSGSSPAAPHDVLAHGTRCREHATRPAAAAATTASAASARSARTRRGAALARARAARPPRRCRRGPRGRRRRRRG